MARIAFLGNFRVDYTTESHHANTLESLGHSVIRLQESEATSESILESAVGSNLFVWVHTHRWNTPGQITMEEVLSLLKQKDIPTMTYHLDLWFGLNRQKDLHNNPIYKNIEHFFTVDSKMADWFNNETKVKGHYLPAGVYDKESYYKPVKFEHDVIFVGSRIYHQEWQYRQRLIKFLRKTYQNSFEHYGKDGIRSVRGNDLNELYASTKIAVGDTLCINFDYPYYWSDRIYETLGRGGFLIHPYIKGLEKEFEDKKHLVFYEYENWGQLKKLIDYYLQNEEEREEIRKAGHEFVKNNYTYKNRWQVILKELNIN